jgi:hypothetical protein
MRRFVHGIALPMIGINQMQHMYYSKDACFCSVFLTQPDDPCQCPAQLFQSF